MRVETQKVGKALVVRCGGELDMRTAPQFRQEIEEKLNNFETILSLILNFADVSFVDSSGLGVILGRYKKMAQRGGQVMLVSVPPQVRKVFELSGIFKIIAHYDSEQEALRLA